MAVKMAVWKMRDETKDGFFELADRYGFSKQQWADILLEIARQILTENTKIELSPGNNGKPKVTITESAA